MVAHEVAENALDMVAHEVAGVVADKVVGLKRPGHSCALV